MKTLSLVVAVVVFSVGCTDARRASFAAYSEPHHIDLYSGGRVVASWDSTGRVECTEGGICQFKDSKTGKFTRTTGDVVVYVK
jgi:hypothetical protein